MAGQSRTPSKKKGQNECEFLRICGLKLGWGKLNGHVVMDVGCGDGRCTINIMSLFPGVKHIVGIDNNKKKIEEAKMNNPHRCIEYRYADIHNRSTTARWECQISKVISIYSLQQSRDQTTAFRHMYLLLRNYGEAAILFSLQSGHYDWFTEIKSHPKWKAYTEGNSTRIPESHEKGLDSNHYKELFKEVGFTVVICKQYRSTYSYRSDDELKAAIFTSCPMTSNIPEDLRDEFQEDSYQAFLKHNKRDKSGRPCVSITNLVAILQKVYPGETAV